MYIMNQNNTGKNPVTPGEQFRYWQTQCESHIRTGRANIRVYGQVRSDSH